MSTPEQRNRFADLLETVAQGRVTATAALSEAKKWKNVSWREPLLRDAWHALVHYDDDADIREKNPKYAQGQRNGMLVWAKRLRLAGTQR